ncbi:hypothetical protein PR729_09025 [Providencia rettgeri]|nr:hypothetical protein PR729_09025 [Providencia rettgeri]
MLSVQILLLVTIYAEQKGKNWLILILPSLTTLALFMIAEIDVPGEGMIHVTPDDLICYRSFYLELGLGWESRVTANNSPLANLRWGVLP